MESKADRERKYDYMLKQSQMTASGRRPPVYLDYGRDGKGRRKVVVMNDKELKPCPFCGGKAKLIKNNHYTDVWLVMCTNCYSESDRHHHEWNAIEVWNRRENSHS